MKAKRERNLKQVGDRWFFDFTLDGKRYLRLGGRTKEEARDAMARARVEILEGPKGGTVDVEDPLFEDFAKEYIETHAKPNKRSWERDERSIKHLKKSFGGRRLSQISLLQVEKYRVERLAQVSLATVHRELACLKGILSKAVDWEKLLSFPLRKIKIDLRQEQHRERVLAPEEECRLLTAAAPHLRPMIILALHTGMRRGEILKLRTEHADLKTRFITIPKENSKSKKLRRVPMDSVVVDLLERLIPKDPGFIFRKANGWPYEDVSEAFQSACRRAKRNPDDQHDKGIEDLRFHDLRHTFETRYIERGGNLANIREIMGHSSIDFSLDHYYHADASRLLDDMEKMAVFPAQHERSHERLSN